MPQLLIETSASEFASEATVDEASGVITNVVLAGQESRNGYRYAPEALERATALYDNKPVFIDHARDPRKPHERSLREVGGSIVNPRWVKGKMRGDIETVGTGAGKDLLALAKANRPSIGMSHVVAGRMNKEETVVEDISEVVSVDAVAFPATTSSFSEQKNLPFTGEPDMADDSATKVYQEQITSLRTERDEMKAELDGLKTTMSEATSAVAKSEKLLGEITAERDALKLTVDGFEAQKALGTRKGEILAQLKEHKLNPEDTIQVSELFMEQLMGVEKADIRNAIIKERAELISTASKSPTSFERESLTSDFDPEKHKPQFAA